MGLTEDIQAFNQRITALEKQRDAAQKSLAVEEHKLSVLQEQLKSEGIEIAKMSEKQIEALIQKLTDQIEAEQERLEAIISEAEKRFEEFQTLR